MSVEIQFEHGLFVVLKHQPKYLDDFALRENFCQKTKKKRKTERKKSFVALQNDEKTMRK